MRISVLHETRYSYDMPAVYSAQHLRLTPTPYEGVSVVSWDIEAPGFNAEAGSIDCFGNLTHLVTVVGEHSELSITARGEVVTKDTDGIVSGLPSTMPDYVYLRETDLTRPCAALRDFANDLAAGPDLDRLHGLMTAINDRMRYRPGATHTATSASESFDAGEGVCQDFAHIFIAVTRLLGYPARYVTGYLVLGDEASAAAHHAWAEVRIADLGWVGFDVANAICPTDRYVRLACGLDYQYAAPIRGMRRGGEGEVMAVHVDVQEAAQQQ